ncbi:hypothetical protein D3C87_1979540 [compost metagenome]
MIECDGGCFQQCGARHAVGKIAIGKGFRANKQVVESTQLIDQTARQRLRLNTHCPHNFAATQTFLRSGFIFHLQIKANR